MVTVSIIVTYKRDKLPYLKECLLHLAEQTVIPNEIIIIEDQMDKSSPVSDPDTIHQVIKEFGRPHQIKYRIIQLDHYSGKSVQINRGIIESTGEYIGICSADDYYEHDFIEESVKCVWADVTWSKFNIVDDKNRLVVPSKQPEWTEGQFLLNTIGFTVKRNMFCCMATWFARREVFIENKFDEKLMYNEDLEWFLRTVFVSKLRYQFINKVLANYRDCSAQTSKKITFFDIDKNNGYTMKKISNLVGKDLFNPRITESELLEITHAEKKNKKVNILNIGYIDCAGVMSKWKNIFDKYSKHKMRNLIEVEGGLRYDTDLFPGDSELNKVLRETDIFIFHPVIKGGENVGSIIEDGIDSGICRIDWKKVTAGKKVYAFVNGSTNLRAYVDKYTEKLQKQYEKIFVSTPDLLKLFPFAIYVPVPLDSLEEDKKEEKYDREFLTIYHFPTDPLIKNTQDFIEACEEINNPYLSYKIVTKVPNKEVLRLKKKIRLCFDHMQGYYGVNSLEAARVGCVPLVGVTKENISLLKEYVGSSDHPFQIVRDKEELKNYIKYYLEHPKELEIDSKFCIEWMKTYWDPKLHLKKFCEVLL
jgi:glycosyltransferase involved in cell wall biosynthesis